MSKKSEFLLDHITDYFQFISNAQLFWFTLNTSMTMTATSPVDSVWTRKTTRLCSLLSRRPGVILSCQLVIASPLVVISLACAALLSSCSASCWLLHRLSPSSHCTTLLSSCSTSWLLHCLLPSSRCATHLSTRHASLLLHRLSSSSCCAPYHPLVFSSCRLVVASPLGVLRSRPLVMMPLVVLLRQLVVVPSSLVVLLLHHPLILSSCWLACTALSSSCHSPSPMPLNASKRCCRHQTPPPPLPLNAVSIIHRCHSCCPLPPSNSNAHLLPSRLSNADAHHRHPPPLMSISIVTLSSPVRSPYRCCH